jgi:cytochrome c-type biogenesis protein CcmH/NrfG
MTAQEALAKRKAVWDSIDVLHQQARIDGIPALRGPPPWDRTVTRDAYFSVADIELRKQLIALYRKADEANRDCQFAELNEARRAVANAHKYSARWATRATVVSVTLVLVGYALGARWEGHGAWAMPGYRIVSPPLKIRSIAYLGPSHARLASSREDS